MFKKAYRFVPLLIVVAVILTGCAGEGPNMWQRFASSVLGAERGSAPDFILFLGRFHPMLLHFPIVLLLIGAFLEYRVRIKGNDRYHAAASMMLLLGAISAVATAIAGLFLSLGEEYDQTLLDRHMWLGLAVAVLAVFLYWFGRRATRVATAGPQKAYGGLLIALIALVTVASHFGGNLTHGNGYLLRYAPNTVRNIAGLPDKPERKDSAPREITDITQAGMFADVIQPILDDRCVSCHNPDKKRGDLLMETEEDLLAGGEDGPILTPGDAEASPMYTKLILPEDDEDRMPKNRRPVTDERIQLIKWWIDSGADFEQTIAEAAPPEDVMALIGVSAQQAGGGSASNLPEIAQADTVAIQRLRDTGLLVMPLAENTNWLQVSCTNVTDTFGDDEMRDLAAIGEQVAWLNVARTQVTDAGMTALGDMPNIWRLHLENTGVTDAALEHVGRLGNLEYLNLYGTQVSDSGLNNLAGLELLESVYLWQTQVTPAGAATLQEALPGVYINLGAEIAAND